jgi:hypothetical protein
MRKASLAFRVFVPTLCIAAALCFVSATPASKTEQEKIDFYRFCYGVHVRKDIATLSANEIVSLRKGVQVMMSRAPSDPTSWWYQANMHGTYDSPAQPLWNGCQHASYFFFSWHRMYLYYFERILRAASGDPYLTLPYWNYTSTSERAIPLPYRQPADPTVNPLYISNRDATMNAGGFAPPSAVSYTIAFSDLNFEAPFGSSFGGNAVPAPIQFDSGTGDLENQPHNLMHCVVGGLMCDPHTAAQDPVFWLHHSNIDRLWKRWLDQGGGRSDPTSDAAWMNTTFQFYDEHGTVVSLAGKDVLNTITQLDYRYDDDPPDWIIWRPPVVAIARQQFPPGPPEQLAVSAVSKVQLATEPVRVELKLSPDATAKIDRLLGDREKAHSVVLNLNGVDFPGNPGSYYEVYINLPWPWREPPDFHCFYYVGNLSLFLPRRATHEGHKPATVSFDLTRFIQTLKQQKAWTGDQLTVTFVLQRPIPPEGEKPREMKPGVRATVENITLVAK